MNRNECIQKSMMTGIGALAITGASAVARARTRPFLVFIDHRHELPHPLHIHSRILQSQGHLHLSDADLAPPVQNGAAVQFDQLAPIGLDQFPPFPDSPLVAAVLFLKVDREVLIALSFRLYPATANWLPLRIFRLAFSKPFLQLSLASLPGTLQNTLFW